MDGTLFSFEKAFTNLESAGMIRKKRDIFFEYEKVLSTFNNYAALVNSRIEEIDLEGDIQNQFKLLKKEIKSINVKEGLELQVIEGWISMVSDVKTVEVPVQDSRTKHLIALLGLEMRKLVEKYPKLRAEVSSGLMEFLSLEILEQSVEVDSLDRIKEIIVYRDDVIKVENVYSYSSEQDRKLIFNLRVLIKALLEELERIKAQTGAPVTLDEGILEMMRAQVLEGIDVEAIIGLFRPLPKTVEV